MCAHNATHNSRTSTRHCHTLDLRHFAGARSATRAFLARYSSSTRRTRRVVLPVMCCTHVESGVRIDFPTPSRVGRMPTSQATNQCLHSHLLRSRRTSQLTRARDAPHSCEYNARVATQHRSLRYESVGEHTIAISIDTRRHNRNKLLSPSQTLTKHFNNMCAHNATHNSRTSTRHCHALDLRHFAGARSATRAFLAQYSSSTRRTRRVVLPAMCCTHVESGVRIDFPTPSRVGRMPTSQATNECLHSRLLRSRRTSQLTRAHDAPHSCEYNARVATQHRSATLRVGR